jgi:hypothetical protein
MSRKKWTPQTNLNNAVLQLREKRRWQIALRRYVLEQQKCHSYAPFFGLENTLFRKWIELQFDQELNWENFSDLWQFDHIVPVAFFDFKVDADLRLCWNFINIRVDRLTKEGTKTGRTDILAAKNYFINLFDRTGYTVCQEMVSKITRIEEEEITHATSLENFILANRDYLETVRSFSADDFERLNTGTAIQILVSEKEFLKKFGG